MPAVTVQMGLGTSWLLVSTYFSQWVLQRVGSAESSLLVAHTARRTVGIALCVLHRELKSVRYSCELVKTASTIAFDFTPQSKQMTQVTKVTRQAYDTSECWCPPHTHTHQFWAWNTPTIPNLKKAGRQGPPHVWGGLCRFTSNTVWGAKEDTGWYHNFPHWIALGGGRLVLQAELSTPLPNSYVEP